jgi:hypothetical protein
MYQLRKSGDWIMRPDERIGGDGTDNDRREIDFAADQKNSTHLGAVQVYGEGEDECQQRAELIVRAANCHDELLEACKNAAARLEMTCEHINANARGPADCEIADNTFQVAQIVRAAIAKATD